MFVNIYIFILYIHYTYRDRYYRVPPKTHLFAVFSDIYSVGRTSLQCWAKPSPVTRLPSERRDANIDRSCVGDIHLDLLSDRDKRLHGKYKAGVLQTGPQFDRHEEGADHDREGCC